VMGIAGHAVATTSARMVAPRERACSRLSAPPRRAPFADHEAIALRIKTGGWPWRDRHCGREEPWHWRNRPPPGGWIADSLRRKPWQIGPGRAGSGEYGIRRCVGAGGHRRWKLRARSLAPDGEAVRPAPCWESCIGTQNGPDPDRAPISQHMGLGSMHQQPTTHGPDGPRPPARAAASLIGQNPPGPTACLASTTANLAEAIPALGLFALDTALLGSKS